MGEHLWNIMMDLYLVFTRNSQELAPVATGGRYDALTERMGPGKKIPAVGAVLRPDLTLLLRENYHD